MTTFNALLVGAGGMGRAWGKNLRDCDEVRLAGWIDLRPDAAAQAVNELGVAGVVTGSDLERALAEIRPDFVVDVTIPEAHRIARMYANLFFLQPVERNLPSCHLVILSSCHLVT